MHWRKKLKVDTKTRDVDHGHDTKSDMPGDFNEDGSVENLTSEQLSSLLRNLNFLGNEEKDILEELKNLSFEVEDEMDITLARCSGLPEGPSIDRKILAAQFLEEATLMAEVDALSASIVSRRTQEQITDDSKSHCEQVSHNGPQNSRGPIFHGCAYPGTEFDIDTGKCFDGWVDASHKRWFSSGTSWCTCYICVRGRPFGRPRYECTAPAGTLFNTFNQEEKKAVTAKFSCNDHFSSLIADGKSEDYGFKVFSVPIEIGFPDYDEFGLIHDENLVEKGEKRSDVKYPEVISSLGETPYALEVVEYDEKGEAFSNPSVSDWIKAPPTIVDLAETLGDCETKHKPDIVLNMDIDVAHINRNAHAADLFNASVPKPFEVERSVPGCFSRKAVYKYYPIRRVNEDGTEDNRTDIQVRMDIKHDKARLWMVEQTDYLVFGGILGLLFYCLKWFVSFLCSDYDHEPRMKFAERRVECIVSYELLAQLMGPNNVSANMTEEVAWNRITSSGMHISTINMHRDFLSEVHMNTTAMAMRKFQYLVSRMPSHPFPMGDTRSDSSKQAFALMRSPLTQSQAWHQESSFGGILRSGLITVAPCACLLGVILLVPYIAFPTWIVTLM